MRSWYEEKIEESVRDVVKLLRDNGFNTFNSCGHHPQPYINMYWVHDDDVTKLYNLLVENQYKNFTINGFWVCHEDKNISFGKSSLSYEAGHPFDREGQSLSFRGLTDRCLRIDFCCSPKLADKSDFTVSTKQRNRGE